MVQRTIQKEITKNLFKGKIILLIGARQVGKSTLLNNIATEIKTDSLWLNADEGDVRTTLTKATTSSQLLKLFGNKKLIIIDEAQQIHDICLKLKLIVDAKKDLQVIATGSSAFELLQKSNEPLTGRKITYQLYPLSFAEMVNNTSLMEEKRMLDNRLIYGNYPEVINNPGNEKEILVELSHSYLYKDLLRYEGMKKSSVIDKLLQALALQVGSEVNFNELSKTIGNIHPETIEKYIDLLEKAFVIYRLPALSTNHRNEIKKGKKIYFFDNGVRNAIISNYQLPHLRSDKGALWENYIVSERLKFIQYNKNSCNRFFWRTFDQAEIDYIEQHDSVMDTFEFKWKTNRERIPASFKSNYKVGKSYFIDTSNYDNILI
jgi:uncharacterized protein